LSERAKEAATGALMSFDITYGPGHSASEPWRWGWSYGTGTLNSAGEVSANASSVEIGSNYDGAGVGFVVDITNEWHVFVTARLSGDAFSEAYGIWGYASAEPMFQLWARGVAPATDPIDSSYEVGIGMRAVAPVFGIVNLGTQRRTVEPTLSYTLPTPVRPGRVFFGAGVKAYAGTTGFVAAAHSSLLSTIRSVRVVGWS
jgi:hypothetical protein